jgi:hypothetical protein
MKAKYLWLVLTTLFFFGCDDNTGGLGLGMLPESDKITVDTKTFEFITESAAFDSVFAKTNIGYVGQFTDHEQDFGFYKGSFLTELNCVDSLTFPKPYDPTTNRDSLNNMIGDVEESFELARIVLGYYSFFGDSLSPMQVSIYELNENLDKNHYTNSALPKRKRLIGRKSFSAIDLADSLRHEANHLHQVSIPVSNDVGIEIIKEYRDHPNTFNNSETFREFFKGLYITSDIGDGTVLYIQHVQLDVVFRSFQLDSKGDVVKKKDGTKKEDGSAADSTYLAYRSFASTMEVIQSNRIDISEGEIKKKVNEGGHTYLKSPAGIYTKAVLPIEEIINKGGNGIDLDQDTINAVKLVFDAYRQEIKSQYSMSPPGTVLLIKEAEVKNFFEKNMIPDNTTSYVAYYVNNQYVFTNIMRLVTSLAKEMEEAREKAGASWNDAEWLKENATIAIIPVSLGTQTSSQGATVITNAQHDLKPAYVKLKGGTGTTDKPTDKLQLQVVYSRFNVD